MTLPVEMEESVVFRLQAFIQPFGIPVVIHVYICAGDCLRVNKDVGDDIFVFILVFPAVDNAVPCNFLLEAINKACHFQIGLLCETKNRLIFNAGKRTGKTKLPIRNSCLLEFLLELGAQFFNDFVCEADDLTHSHFPPSHIPWLH